MAASNPTKFEWAWPDWAKKFFRQLTAWSVPTALAAAVLLTAFASWTRTLEIYELQTYDWRCRFLSKPAVFPDVLLIEIGEDSLNNLGRWPFDRAFHGVLLEALRDNNAGLLAFDVLFAEPSSSDEGFVQASADFKKAYFCDVLQKPVTRNGRKESPGIMVSLLENIRQSAAGVGFVNAFPDIDGKIRRLSPVAWIDGQPRLHLSILMAMDRLGVKPEQVTYGKNFIDLGGKLRIPLDENGDTMIRFNGRWEDKTFEHASYFKILKSFQQSMNGEPTAWDLGRLKDRVCIVGLTAVASHDLNPVPLEPRYPQVGIYANFFENMMTGDFMRRAPRWINLVIAVLLGVGGWFVSRIKRLPLGIVAAMGIWIGFVGLNLAIFVLTRSWLDLFFPSVLWWGVYLSMIVWRSMQEMRKREMIEAEMSIASKIQRSFLPASMPVVDGYEMEVYMRPAKHVGGDLYAALKLDERHLGIMCGDVSGKGMPAALFMARSVAEFRFHAASGSDPAETLRRLNNGLADAESSGLFVTMNYAVADLDKKQLVLSNGGHMPVVLIRKDGSSDLLSPDGGMPIGLIGDVDFGRLEVPLAPGDIFLMYSDGVSEARNRKIQDFEIERVVSVAQGCRTESASVICNRIIQAVDAFVAGAPQHDDMTLFVFKVRD